jgi:hypothetical protein
MLVPADAHDCAWTATKAVAPGPDVPAFDKQSSLTTLIIAPVHRYCTVHGRLIEPSSMQSIARNQRLSLHVAMSKKAAR